MTATSPGVTDVAVLADLAVLAVSKISASKRKKRLSLFSRKPAIISTRRSLPFYRQENRHPQLWKNPDCAVDFATPFRAAWLWKGQNHLIFPR